MNRLHPARNGFSLIEILVVVGTPALLTMLMIPAVQSARESARRSLCTNNLREMALAVELHAGAKGYYPSSFRSPPGHDFHQGAVDGWSAHVMILPFLEQQVTQDRIDMNRTFDENFAPVVNVKDGVKPISAVRVPVFLCPSEARDQVRIEDGRPRHYPVNYGVNVGEWFVFDPATSQGGSGAFYPNSELQPPSFSDGLSKTMMAAEVRAWRPYYRNAGIPETLGIPPSAESVCGYGGPEFKTDSGHTEWVDGRAHQTGFTTTFAPNVKVLCEGDGQTFDIDWTNQQEGKSGSIRTYAAVTARSYHPNAVLTAMMDASVRPFTSEVEISVWRGLSTRNGSD